MRQNLWEQMKDLGEQVKRELDEERQLRRTCEEEIARLKKRTTELGYALGYYRAGLTMVINQLDKAGYRARFTPAILDVIKRDGEASELLAMIEKHINGKD